MTVLMRHVIMTSLLAIALALPAGCVGSEESSEQRSDEPAASNDSAAVADAQQPAASQDPTDEPAETDNPPPPDPSGPPRIRFERTVHDFGSFSETETRSGRIRFTSMGGEALVIDEIKTTCGCTLASMNKMRYEPGETGELELTFEPTAPGEQRKYVTVFSNAPTSPQRLTVTADVLPFITFEPRMLRLGVLEYREPHRAEVTISCIDPDARLVSVRTTNQHISAEVAANSNPADASSGTRLEVSIAPTAPWGGLFSWLIVTYEGRPEPGAAPIRHASRIRIQGQLFGELVGEPDTIRFGAETNESFERSLELRRISGEPFEILSAEAQSASLSNPQVRIEPLAPHKHRLVFTATAGPVPGTGQGAVLLRTSVAGEELLRIPVVGRVRAAK